MTGEVQRIFAFDMDGTLLPGTTGLLELSKVLGTTELLADLERQYGAGSLNTVDFTRRISAAWGVIAEEVSRQAFESAAKLEGIAEVLEEIRRNGAISCVVTMSQDVFANHFLGLGFDYVYATSYPPHNNNDFSRVLSPDDKIAFLKNLATESRLDFRDTVAFGDSISDVPLFSEIKNSVAVNGDHHVAAKAAFSYRGDSILEAFEQSKPIWSMS